MGGLQLCALGPLNDVRIEQNLIYTPKPFAINSQSSISGSLMADDPQQKWQGKIRPWCIRYCAGPATPTNDSSTTTFGWANENLLAIDPMERYLTYEINESNMGFDNYVATIKVLLGDNDNQNGCEIEWSFVANPMKGWKLEDFISLLRSNLDTMAKRMEEASQC
ncbi:hypothetical protein IFM89_026732 [Coptis chinensis]|uniref:Lachrymatory-factor synthase n=1 Tax=Coptis chinensis TaxID=261450 RepID=A0A835IF75_9MAGN|nr:hypothetical protein IFM89_026732 [Coptis chinensis]